MNKLKIGSSILSRIKTILRLARPLNSQSLCLVEVETEYVLLHVDPNSIKGMGQYLDYTLYSVQCLNREISIISELMLPSHMSIDNLSQWLHASVKE